MVSYHITTHFQILRLFQEFDLAWHDEGNFYWMKSKWLTREISERWSWYSACQSRPGGAYEVTAVSVRRSPPQPEMSEPPSPTAPLPSIRFVTSTLGPIENKDRLKNDDWEITRGDFLGKQVRFQTLSGGWLLQHWFGRKCWNATMLSSQTQTLVQPLCVVWHFKHESSTSDGITNKWGIAVPESS